ncbi:SDR family oxidoreductase [Mycobacterium riyadhense]|uniref:SDR family oxidoreductase n=1 Tax=Mycobacterium riyadhense TaxID=486698 RepID=UPI0019504E14|nr:SDR family oxidoreductase [Mycobacterium riyadhense]
MKVVVITGASTGIGRASALALDRNGFRVFAGIRKRADGEALRVAASERLRPVFLDVTAERSIGAAARLVADAVGRAGEAGLAGLVNNAGTTLPGPVEYLALDAFRHQLEVNLVGPLAVTKAFLPLLVRGGGRIVNVTSGAGKAGVPLMAPYVAAKHGLEGLSDVLRLELGQLGVGVSVIEPGFVATDMRGKLERDTDDVIRSLPEEGRSRYARQLAATAEAISTHAAQGSTPDVIADVVVHVLTSKKPRTRYPAGAGAKRMLLLRRVLSDRQFDRIIRRMSGLPNAPTRGGHRP